MCTGLYKVYLDQSILFAGSERARTHAGRAGGAGALGPGGPGAPAFRRGRLRREGRAADQGLHGRQLEDREADGGEPQPGGAEPRAEARGAETAEGEEGTRGEGEERLGDEIDAFCFILGLRIGVDVINIGLIFIFTRTEMIRVCQSFVSQCSMSTFLTSE